MRRHTRPIYFVCIALSEIKQLLHKTILASSSDEAIDSFTKEFNIKPTEVLGPFYKKRVQAVKDSTEVIFTNDSKDAEYNGWLVNATVLKFPENHAYLIFKRRMDEKIMSKPQGTTIVPIYDLRFLNE